MKKSNAVAFLNIGGNIIKCQASVLPVAIPETNCPDDYSGMIVSRYIDGIEIDTHYQLAKRNLSRKRFRHLKRQAMLPGSRLFKD